MSQFSSLLASTIIAPNDEDWCVRFVLKDGTTIGRRVSPPSLDEQTAVRRARLSLGAKIGEVVSFDAFRYSSTRRVIITAPQGGWHAATG